MLRGVLIVTTLLERLGRVSANAAGRDSILIRYLRPTYEKLLEISTSGRGVERTINGESFRIVPSVRHQMAAEYESQVARFLRERVMPGSICVDVGANVGVYVLQLSRWSEPNGRVTAFEPNPNARELLARHLQLNGITSRVEIVAAAVGAEEGNADLYLLGADGMARLGAPNPLFAARASRVVVPVVTLDGYCESHALLPDWILIDIEGYELAALRGAEETLRRGRGKLGLIVEMHPNVWELAATTRKEVETFLKENGLRAIGLTGQEDPLGEYGVVHLSFG